MAPPVIDVRGGAHGAEISEGLAALVALDARLDREIGPRRTLDPTRSSATRFEALGAQLAPQVSELPEGTFAALVRGLGATADAIVEHFPDNVFWDLDALVAAVVREASAQREGAPAALQAAFADVVALHALFGRATAIRFRYVHDFIYGFDWAKWVRRDPTRRHIGPFDRAFLRVLIARGHELLALIAADDAKYPRLRDERPRNPFGFSREPGDEARLHRALAAEGLIPVEAWRLHPSPRWDRPFADLREAQAAVADDPR